MTFRVIIAGGRNFNDYEKVKENCDSLLAEKSDIVIICGMARGVDLLGRRYAGERGYKVAEFPADWNGFGKSAGYIRNTEMADNADALIAFWDGNSKGTNHMINIATDKKLFIRIVKI